MATVLRFQLEVLPHVTLLHADARRLTRNHADAEDLVQETLLHAFRGLHTFDAGTNVKSWLRQVMRNLWISAYRRACRRPAEWLTDDITDSPFSAGNISRSIEYRSTEEHVLSRLGDNDLRRAMAALPEIFQIAIYYADVEGYSTREVAALLGIPEGTAASRLHRGRRQLRSALSASRRTRGNRP